MTTWCLTGFVALWAGLGPPSHPGTERMIGAGEQAGDTVQGTAIYRERIALPPGAILEVRLEDVSLADAPAVEIGSVRLEDPGSPPFEFAMGYDPESIDPRHSYVVRATIRAQGRLLFTTDTAYPVLTRGAGSEVDLLLVRAPTRPTGPDGPRQDCSSTAA